MLFRQIVDPKLAQYAYLIGCQKTKEALLVDPERDIDRYVEAAEREGVRITAVAETHIHADFLSGAREFAERHGTALYLSAEGGEDWQYAWARGTRQDGTPYDVTFLRDGDTFSVGNIEIRAAHTPGHTPEHLSYLVTDRGGGATTPMGVVTGDFVFVGDLGRPDLLEQAAGMHGVQEPSARQLYASLPTFTALEDHLQVWPAHGAGSACGKALGAVPQTTVGYERRYNASLAAAEAGEDAFVEAILAGQPEPPMYFARMKRDNKRGVPVLGEFPQPRALSVAELGGLAERTDSERRVVVDTRLDRSAFMAAHLPGALYAPMNKSFNSVVGSLVVDETTPLVLIVEAARVEEAVRDLVRIGFDRVEAYATPETLERFFEEGGAHATIEEVSMPDVARLREEDDVAVVDVRYASEYASGH
ncbi:MAG: MBL fold metallo-hydrolase, partial [Rubricoccaceae bacterium]|nr:MBL fold metallo-hydrolase [Rubricoccaceae bacterium]